MKRRFLFPFIQQRDASECGTTCLAMIFKYYGLENVQSLLRENAEVSSSGVDLYTLKNIAVQFGFIADGYKLDFDQLPAVRLPLLAHYSGNHFIVIYRISSRYIWISDPGSGKTRMPRIEFEKKWNGIILELIPGDNLFKGENALKILGSFREKKEQLNGFYTNLLKPFRKPGLEVLLASLILQLLGVTLPFFTQAILDKVIAQRHIQLLFAILLGMTGIFVFQILLGYVRTMLLTQLKIKLELKFFSSLFNHLIRLKQKYFDSHKKEDFINRFQENLKIRSLFTSSVLQSLITLIFLINYIIILFIYNGFLALLAFGFMAVIIIVTVFYMPRLRKLESKIFHKNEKVMGSFLDTLLGIQEVKLRVMERIKFDYWEKQYKASLNDQFSAEKSYMIMNSIMGAVNIISQITIYWIGAYFTFQNNFTIGQYVAFISIYGLIIGAVNTISGLWFMFMELSVTYEKLNDILIQPVENNSEDHPGNLHNPVIRIENLSFKYLKRSEQYTLKDINLTIPYGIKLGITGRNGSGKTTLVKLLAGLYDHYEGSIYINDRELRQHPLASVRRTVYLLPQNIYLFNGTIKDNIKDVFPSATDQMIIEAAALADFHPFVKSLYMGYNHMIGNSGDNLSSGQRLKLALARLFLSNPQVIILDESSSVLDVQSERIIFDNIYNKFQGKTIITIAHRMGTLKNLDMIINLEESGISEQGTHDELILKKGHYYNLIKNNLEY